MDPAAFATTILEQFVTVWHAPAPFIVAIVVVGWLIWRALEWRHGGTIARQKDELEALRRPTVQTASKPVTVAANSVTFDEPAKPEAVAAPREGARVEYSSCYVSKCLFTYRLF